MSSENRNEAAPVLGCGHLVLPPVLDACGGSRMFWFVPADPRAVFIDKRRETHELPDKSSRSTQMKTISRRPRNSRPPSRLLMLRHMRKGSELAANAIKAVNP